MPEFDKNRHIEGVKALIFEIDCKYDIIFGLEFLNMIGMDIRYSTSKMEWYNNTLSMREPWDIINKDYVQMCDTYHMQDEEEYFGEDWLDSYAIDKILDAQYDKPDIKEVLLKQNHLDANQKQYLE